ncbi:MAG: CRISPR-associated ring nuclease Csm6 [Bacteroidota bacterium]
MAVARPYNLIIAVGMSPAVVTETIFEIYYNRERIPASVDVVTTRQGQAFVEALLLGKDRLNPFTGEPFESAKDRWTPFWEDVLERPEPVEIDFHVAQANGVPLDDIRDMGDDTRFANVCYALVEERTRPDENQLVGSIAGGRKTMGAHLMTAFSVYARTNDRLTHILVHDPDLERDREFYYPNPKEHGANWRRMLDLVDIEFPRLRSILSEEQIIQEMKDRDQGLEDLLATLTPHALSARDVERVVLELESGSARLVLYGTEGQLAQCALTPLTAATLAVFAEQRAQTVDAVPATSMYAPDAHQARRSSVQKQRSAIAALCGSDAFKPWTSANDVSKAISAYHRRLQDTPLTERLLDIEGLSSDPRSYDWHGQAPNLQIAATYPDANNWPFDVLGKPIKL